MTFQDFNFKEPINKALQDAGFKEPSPIQAEGIPVVLTGKDVVAQAQTGTGKTAAFALPMLERLRVDGSIEALVVVPTRELAMQVSDEIFKFGKFLGVKTATVYGGSSYNRQLDHISRANIIIATPGRLIDLLSSGKINIKPDFVVLDEADEMLDMGFLEPIKEIFEFVGDERQTMMFSATMPQEIKNLAKQILKDPEFVSVKSKNLTNDNITQQYYVVNDYERDEALVRLLDFYEPTKAIIFCRMKKEVDRLLDHLSSIGFAAKGLHGDMDQRERESVMRTFKGKGGEILVATDVAARGLDVNDVTHVFNYHLPFDSESYVHRIGRTGRAGKKGLAISLLSPAEFKSLKAIQRATKDSLVNDVIPTIDGVKSKKVGSFIDRVKEAEVSDAIMPIVDELKREFTDADLVEKLVALLRSDVEVRGNNVIGKSKQEVSHLIKNFREDRGGRGGRGGYRGGNRGGGYRGGNRNSSGGGYRGNGGNRNSSGGGYRGGNRSSGRDS